MSITDTIIHKILSNAQVCGEVLLNLLNNILDIGKVNSGNLDLNPTDSDIRDIINKVIIIEKEKIIKKNIMFHCFVDKKIPSLINIDSGRLLQIIMNLLANAIKFTQNHGRVSLVISLTKEKTDILKTMLPRISCFHEKIFHNLEKNSIIHNKNFERFKSTDNILQEDCDISSEDELLTMKNKNISLLSNTYQREIANTGNSNTFDIIHLHDSNIEENYQENNILKNFSQNRKEKSKNSSNDQQDYLKIEIHDNGCGITEKNFSKIFKLLSQADSTIYNKYGGTGLGLWICKQLCDKMGGEIQGFSEFGRGSIFKFYLPFNKISENIPSQSSALIPILRALIVDDNNFNNELHKAMLERLGVNCTLATSGREAVEIYCSKPEDYFDFIFMDLHMADIDGKTACVMIRRFEDEHKRKKIDIYIISGN